MGKKAVIAVPMPRVISERIAKVCWRIKIITRIAVKARKPGISLRLCKTPISSPVNAALSTTKLLSRTCQVAKAMVLPIASRNSNCLRLCSFDKFILFNSWFGLTAKISYGENQIQ